MADVHGEMVQFNGSDLATGGYLARPQGDGPFRGVIVIQEWWGLNDNIKDIANRFAGEGFAAFAPDLYDGKVTPEPDEAQKLMMQLNMDRASQRLVKAAEFLSGQPYITGGLGATGFCMGGGLALTLACDTPLIKCVAPFYGVNPQPIDRVANLQGPVIGTYAEHDGWVPAEVVQALKEALDRHGKQHDIKIYPGTEHGFFNDTRPEVYNAAAAEDAWKRMITAFKANL